jgi:hypothetical protein
MITGEQEEREEKRRKRERRGEEGEGERKKEGEGKEVKGEGEETQLKGQRYKMEVGLPSFYPAFMGPSKKSVLFSKSSCASYNSSGATSG